MICLITMNCADNSNNSIAENIPVSNNNHKMNFYGNFDQNPIGQQLNMLNEFDYDDNNEHCNNNNSPFLFSNDDFVGKVCY